MRMHRDITGYERPDDTGDDDRIANPWDEDGAGDPVLEGALRAEVVETVYEALNTLAGRQRQVIEFALKDYTDREIAEELGVSVQAVNKCRLAAITALRRAVLSKFSIN
jgi:DNA-directed RNA polymerase specialized sigma24 family protein